MKICKIFPVLCKILQDFNTEILTTYTYCARIALSTIVGGYKFKSNP